MKETDILNYVLRSTMEKENMKRTAEPGRIVIVKLTALDDFGINNTEAIKLIYDTGNLQKDLCRSIFVGLPNTGVANECKLHRSIRLMSRMTKLKIQILMNS